MGFFGGGNQVTVRVVGDKTDLDRKLRGATKNVKTFEGGMDKAAKGIKKSFINAAKGIGAAFAIKEVGKFVGDTIRAFSDLNESVNAVEVVFGEASDEIKILGENAAETVGLSEREFNDLAVSFSAFVDKIADASGGDVVGVLEILTTRIADFASVMNLDVTEAAEKFRSGLAGETEPLRKFGLDVSAAAVTAKGLEEGLGDINGVMSESDKVFARYLLIMEQTDDVAGDFENTSGDLANSLRILESKFEDVQAKIGEAFISPVATAVGLMTDWIDILDRITDSTDDMTEAQSRSILGKFFDVFGWKPFIGAAEDATRRIKNLTGVTGDFEEAQAALRLGPDNPLLEYSDNIDDIVDAFGLSRRPIQNFGRDMEGAGDATGDAGDAADDAALSVEDLADAMLAAIDPAFGLLRAHERFTDAQRDYNEAVGEFGSGSGEARDAMADLLESAGKLNSAEGEFATKFGPDGEQAFRDLAVAAGIYGDDLEDLLDFLFRIGRATVNLPPVPTGGGGGGSPTSGPFHTGGRVNAPRGQEVLARVLGGETFTNPAHGNGGGGGGNIINYYAGTQIANTRILRELVEMGRRR